MAGFYTHGPTLTYVTDPDLTADEQRRVLRDFVGCSNDQMLRVAIRMPDMSDDEVTALLDWYLDMVHQQGLAETMLPPLLHDRSQLVRLYPEARLWLPANQLNQAQTADVFSVHSLDEAQRAIDRGAGEVMFGHVFETASHPDIPGRGIGALTEIASAIRTDINTPIITAIGGVGVDTVAVIGRARVFNVATIRAISRSPHFRETLERIRANWVMALIDEDLNDPKPLALGREWGIWHRWTADEQMYQQETKNDQR